MRFSIPSATLPIMLLGCALSAHAGASNLKDCEGSSFQQTLAPSTAALNARAVWLNGRLARWPGATSTGVFKLYHSPAGGIVAAPGSRVSGAVGAIPMTPYSGAADASVSTRFKYVPTGATLALAETDLAKSRELHREQLVLVQEDADGVVLAATRLQSAGALDDLFAAARNAPGLGVIPGKHKTTFGLWAPTAQRVVLCTYDRGGASARTASEMLPEAATGIWRTTLSGDLAGKYYQYMVDVVVDGAGLVRNRVTDPYSISLDADSRRSYVGNLASPALKPAGWDRHAAPLRVKAHTDMVVYEVHVRDFSINDPSVAPAKRGKYGAFGQLRSNGMRHLAALSRAGLTDIHLLPIYDIASIPERGCAVPSPMGAADSRDQQALVNKTAHSDCFNWGYDPYHYSAPEGSYASDPDDGARRIIELREMVMNLHRVGLRVGMDVVYNHTFASGQKEKSVLDRIVPGYYHRLNAVGAVEQSTCCDNTATENMMMARLMIDSAELWTRHYKIDSFRFDLMGHQPRTVMEQLQARVNKAAGRHVNLIGEGWNFGEVENGKRFVQASQLSLGGSGIGTFSDRGRDAVRGGAAGDAGEKMISQQGFINGLVYDPNALAGSRKATELLQTADMIKVGLAGSVRSFPLQTYTGKTVALEAIDYNGQSAGYASEPGEAVNYVENHDNQTLYDMNVFKLPVATSTAERARVQMLAAAINAFSQGVAYFHAGIDTLRSKSLDRNSFNSGDWFNRIDWSYRDNYFGTGLPPEADNGKDYALLQPLLANPTLKPTPGDIAYARDAFRDLLRIRASSTLFRLRTAADIGQRLRFYNTGAGQAPTVVGARIYGQGYPGAAFKAVNYFINVDKIAHGLALAPEQMARMRLHPVHTASGAADKRAAQATYDSATGMLSIPARTAVVFVE